MTAERRGRLTLTVAGFMVVGAFTLLALIALPPLMPKARTVSQGVLIAVACLVTLSLGVVVAAIGGRRIRAGEPLSHAGGWLAAGYLLAVVFLVLASALW